MKTYQILALALLAALPVRAQLSMPDPQDAGAASAPDAAGAQAEAPQEAPVQAKYNTPSESYKTERNDIRRGNRLFEQKKYHEALEAYNEALQYNSGSIRAKYNKAVALLQLAGDDNKGTANDPRVQAGALFESLIPDARQYDPEIAEKAWYNLGNMAFNDEQYDRSIAAYESALRLQPDNMQARENLRLAQLKKQEQEQNQDQQNQDQDKKDQEQQQQQHQQDQQQQQDQNQQQQQQPQPKQQQPMTQSAQQILQTMQNKENQTRKKVKEEEQPAGRPQTDKPW